MPERQDFAEFLRARRARLKPEDVGLLPGTRRRVAGLRREEVAQLAGVGLTWYTWLEQGRPIAASDQVLLSIARALRLTEDERDHLLYLAGRPVPERTGTGCVSTAHLTLLEKLMPLPGAIQTSRFDLITFNRAYRFLFDDLERLPVSERNCARLIFTNLVWQRSHVDVEHAQGRVAARLRHAYGRHHDQPEWQEFVADLRRISPVFRQLWDHGDVIYEPGATKRMRHATEGELNLQMSSVWLDESMGTRMVWFTPLDSATSSRLDTIAAAAAEEPLVSSPAA